MSVSMGARGCTARWVSTFPCLKNKSAQKASFLAARTLACELNVVNSAVRLKGENAPTEHITAIRTDARSCKMGDV
ncbi:hypothetical protein TMM008_16480 [Pseudomonas sp. 008]|nr:hypothetical protein TMM008_16480 [Pseudomonas sp. 008]